MDYVVYWPTGIWNCMKSVHIKLRRRNCLTWSKTKTNSEPINWSFQESQMHNLGLGLWEILGLGFRRWESSSICVGCASFSFSSLLYKIPLGFRHIKFVADGVSGCDGITNRVTISNYENALVSPELKLKPTPNQNQTMGPSKSPECKIQNTLWEILGLGLQACVSCQVFVCASFKE